ncbi:hypothetical protein Tco_1440682 [Tanacetum coccineum]
MEPWQSDLEGLTDGAAQGMPEDTMLPDKPTKKGKAAFENPNGFPRQKHATNAAFYSKPFTFKETQRRFQKTQAEILGIQQRSDESLRDYLQRADEANTENRLKDSRWVPNDNKSGQGYKDTSRRHKDKYVHRLRVRPNERTNVNNSSFTPLIKSPAEIYATSEGKAVLRPPSRMFAPAH